MPRAKVTATIDEELIEWVDELVEAKIFRSRSHALEYALNELRKNWKKRE